MFRDCDSCGNSYEAKRQSSRFCSPKCRIRNNGKPKRVKTLPQPVGSHGLVTAVAATLTEAKRLDSYLGQQAIALAGKVDAPFETGSSVAALSKELRAVMVEALQGAQVAADPLDELRRRREFKLSAS